MNTTKTPKRVPNAVQTKPKSKVAARAKEGVEIDLVTPTRANQRKTAPAIPIEVVALRAYFIAEKRHADGIPGEEVGDWLEAERQLLAERAAQTAPLP